MTALRTLWTETRAQARTRQEQRSRTQQLARELATYTTPDDRLELATIIARAEDPEVVRVAEAVRRQQAA